MLAFAGSGSSKGPRGHKLGAERNRLSQQAGESGRAEIREFTRGPLRSLDFFSQRQQAVLEGS